MNHMATAPGPLRAWLTISFFFMFAGLFIHDSRTALLNILDATFFLPALVILARNLFKDPGRTTFPLLGLPLYLFLLWSLASMGWAEAPNISRTIRAVLQIMTLLATLMWLWQKYPTVLMRSLLDASALVAPVLFIVATSFYSQNPLTAPLYYREAELIFSLPMQHPITSTMALMTPVFVLLGGLLHAPRKHAGIWHLVAALVITACILLMQRRTGVVALGTGVVVLSILSGNRKILLVLAAVLTAALTFFLLDINKFASKGSNLRLEIWQQYLHMALERPLAGHGLGHEPPGIITMRGSEPVSIAHPHNILLTTFYFTGLIGALLLVGAWLSAAAGIVWSWNIRKQHLLMIAPLAPGIIAMQFDGAFPLVPFHSNWMTLWIPLCLALVATTKATWDKEDDRRITDLP